MKGLAVALALVLGGCAYEPTPAKQPLVIVRDECWKVRLLGVLPLGDTCRVKVEPR